MEKKNKAVLRPLKKENVLTRFVRFCARLKTSEYIYLFAAFLLPFAIMLGIYACMEMHPFGNNSVLMLDLQAQYIYYYEEIRTLLTEGGSFLYSWKRTLGGEFMGIIAYYGASPYNLIFALFPEHMTADAMMFINLMKIGSMGLTFGIYMHKTRKPGEMKTLTLASMYALCAYAVVQTLDPMWLDALVLLPLLILGLEALIKERKIILYTAALTMVFITNYYIGYMTGIFTFIYFLYYYFVNRTELLEKYPLPEGKWYKKAIGANGVQTFVRFSFGTLIALMIAAFMLIAALYSLSFGKSDFQSTNWVFALRFDFIEIFNKMLIGSYDTVNPSGLPMIYSGMLALLGVPMFYMAPSVKPAKKIGATLVLLVLTLSFMINPADLVWHGFNLPNWLNYRYSFVFSFFVITMVADALCDVKKIKPGNVAAVGGIIIALVAVLQNIKYHIDPDQGAFASANQKNLTSILLAVVFTVVYVIIIYLCSNDKLENTGTFMLAAIVCVEMFACGLITINDVTYDIGMVRYGSVEGEKDDFTSYTSPIKRIEHVVDEITGRDKSFYRMESKIYRRTGGENESMAFGFNGIAHSTSTLNTNVIRLFNNMGYASQSHWTKYLGGTPLADALLGIKYVVTADDMLDSGYYDVAYKALEQLNYGKPLSTIYAMENKYALPIAYGVSTSVLEKLNDMSTPYFPTGAEAQNEMMEAFLWDTEFDADMFTYIYAHYFTDGCTASTFIQNCKYIDENGEEKEKLVPYRCFKANDGETSPTISYTFNAQETGPLYAHFPMDNFGKACDIYVNDTFICRYDSGRIENLGNFNKGDKVAVELVIDDVIYFSEESRFYFFQNNYEAQTEALEYLKNASMNVEEHSNTMLKGTISIPEGQELILTTIPYDEGWNCYIDGEKVEIKKAMGSLLAIETTVGEHEIELRYMPKCYVVGFIVSAVGIVSFAGVIAWEIIKKKRAKAAAACEEATENNN